MQDDEFWTPLMIAVSVGSVEITALLLEKKADPNLINKQKRSPLFYAASKNRIQIAQLLLEAGANVDMRDSLGQSAAFRAMAAEEERDDIIEYLVDNNVNLDVRNKEEKTAFDVCSKKFYDFLKTKISIE